VKIQQGNEIDQTESIFETTNVRAKLWSTDVVIEAAHENAQESVSR
jgi:hypothetical protein